MTTKSMLSVKFWLVILLLIIFYTPSYGSQSKQVPKGCKWIEIETGSFQVTIEEVINKIDFDSWPQSDKLKVFPNIWGQLLKDPNLVLYPSINPDGIFLLVISGPNANVNGHVK